MPETGLCLYRKEAYRGLTLFASSGGKEVRLIDMNGQVVHTWHMPLEVGSYGELLPTGNLLYALRTPDAKPDDFDGSSGGILELDWDSNIAWKYEDPYLHHGFSRLPNGNTLVLRWIKTPEEIVRKVKGGLPDAEKGGLMWSDAISEIDPSGKTIWEWKAYEHLDPEVDTICPLCFRNRWTEANNIKITPEGPIIVSFKRISKILQIDKETGKIDWRFGEWPEIVHLHDFSILENGNLLAFESGSHGISYEVGCSQILEFDLETKETVWQYLEMSAVDFFSGSSGNCQHLPYGNILICEGDYGRIFEINRNGEIVWEYISPFYNSSKFGRSNMIPHAQRYSPDYEGLKFINQEV